MPHKNVLFLFHYIASINFFKKHKKIFTEMPPLDLIRLHRG